MFLGFRNVLFIHFVVCNNFVEIVIFKLFVSTSCRKRNKIALVKKAFNGCSFIKRFASFSIGSFSGTF